MPQSGRRRRKKKMIASQLFSRVEIGKGYKIHLEMNMTYRQFCEDWLGEADFTANKCCY